jgi:hypothetical protein
MTSPEDDDRLEEALRRALSEAASEVEPGTDGLDKIRARIAGRPPRPWLLSAAFGFVDRVRNWTWRGHWAWPDRLSRLAEARWSQLRRGNFPRWGVRPLRLAAVLAGIAVIASVTFGVQPLRIAILQASTEFGSGNGSPSGTAGTEGNGTRSFVAGRSAPSAQLSPTGVTWTSAGSAPNFPKASGTPKPHSSAGGKCTSTGASVVAEPASSSTVAPSSATATEAAGPTVSTTVTPAPVYTDTSVVTCPVTSPAKSATPTPTPTSGSSGSGTTSPSPEYSDPNYTDPASSDPTGSYPTGSYPTGSYPAGSYPAAYPPTAYPGPSGYGYSSPSAPPYWPGRRPHGSPFGHGR